MSYGEYLKNAQIAGSVSATVDPVTGRITNATANGRDMLADIGVQRSYFPPSTGKLLTDWSDGSRTFTGTVSDEAAALDATTQFNGTSMLKLTMPSSGDGDGIFSLKNTLTTAVQAAGIRNIALPFRFSSNRNDGTGVGDVRLFVYFTTGYCWFQFYINGQQKDRVSVLTFNKASVAGYGGGASSASWGTDNVTALGVQVVATFNQQRSWPMWVGPVRMNVVDKPRFVLTFDHPYDSVLKYAKPVLDYHRVKGTIAVSVPLLGTASHATEAQLQQFYDAGWDIILHSYTSGSVGYNNAGSFADAAAVASSITAGKAWLQARGWTRGANHIVIPIKNAFEQDQTDAVQQKVIDGFTQAGVLSARTAVDYSGRSQSFNAVYRDYAPWWAMPAMPLVSTTTTANANAWTDRASENGENLIVVAHEIVADSATPAGNQIKVSDFDTIVSYMAGKRNAGQGDFYTISEMYDSIQAA